MTPGQRQVLDLLVDGLTNVQIARRLGVTERTVKTRLSNGIYPALGVTNRTQAALLWRQSSEAAPQDPEPIPPTLLWLLERAGDEWGAGRVARAALALTTRFGMR